ncbi:MAG: hypothetical protein GX572_01790 [Clostridia bacterium]|nr:hypothetical protein [Clostridia bacterium]
MFPLVHYFVNSQIYGSVPKLMVLGGLFPDIAAGAGWDRDKAHTMGADFHAWCGQNAPQALPLARGIISHGTEPPGVDFHADEFWPGYRKGWCFLVGEKYLDQVAQVTRLPQNLIWWKAHNFVEISYELITDADHPQIKNQLMAALEDHRAVTQAAAVLADYIGLPRQDIISSFQNVPNIFAIDDISPERLAYKQNLAFMVRHGVMDADVKAMAELLEQMSRDLKPGYYPFCRLLIDFTARVLAAY